MKIVALRDKKATAEQRTPGTHKGTMKAERRVLVPWD